jgi:pyridoxine kinase
MFLEALVQKRVAALHDLSGFGRCSLTVALPILSATGANCAVLPTALLSAHTGFSDSSYLDLTCEAIMMAAHWQVLGLRFDAMYSGFLGSIRQVGVISQIFADFAPALVLVDPVMGDHGRLYRTFGADFPAQMRLLTRRAHIITPNMTEAALLLGEDYRPGPYSRSYITEIVKKLSEGGRVGVVVTGVNFTEAELGAAVYIDGVFSYHSAPRVPQDYPGTGDIFASVLLGGLLRGESPTEAGAGAVEFIAAAIARTFSAKKDPREGVMFEQELHRLIPQGTN